MNTLGIRHFFSVAENKKEKETESENKSIISCNQSLTQVQRNRSEAAMAQPQASTPKREDMDKELETTEKYFDLSGDGPGDHTLPNADQTMMSPRQGAAASTSNQDNKGKLTRKKHRKDLIN